MLTQYVANRIDDAVANGWIKVYYQPVIRSLTGELCGFESLSRWIDPQHGFLSPAQFIGALEEFELIYKLDIYMVEKVCSDIHDRLSQGLDMVPVSINFSRLDFLTCDMLEVVEKAVDKYDIPRDYLHIEITESMMITDTDFMQDVIEGFRKHGYAVWMDDFGSGYSSLNLLKDFNVDVMKLDMKFLESMDAKSKAIMKSVITMAKDIGIKTLAEGVETLEEVEFLKEMGCGRLQGYYYGKPMPLEDAFANLKDKGIPSEERRWNHFYDTAEFHIRSTDAPLELITYDGENFKTLFMNDAYKMQIFEDMPSLEEIDRRIYHTHSPLIDKYRNFAQVLIRSKRPEAFYYSVGGNYMRLNAREVAECSGRHIIKGSIINLTSEKDNMKSEELDYKLRELSNLFAVVLLFRPEDQLVAPIIGKFRFFRGPEKMDMRQSTQIMAKNILHPHDRQRYVEFMDSSTFAERIKNGGLGFIEDAFRYKNEFGEYAWVTTSVMTLPGSGGKEFLYCVKPMSRLSSQTLLNYGSSVSSILQPDEYSLLWYNILWNSSIKFFWKDKDRRFLGASKAFLDYFKIDSAEEIIGKRGEDMNWHLSNSSYSDNEEDIIEHGSTTYNVPCQCIIDGIVHNTITSKIPVYLNGEIKGLMGYIVDTDEAMKNLGSVQENSDFDEVTGVMNINSFVKTLVYYAEQYGTMNKDYGIILLRNLKHERITESFGQEYSDSVLQVIADKIVDVAGDRCAVARTGGSYFAVLTHTDSVQELKDTAEELKDQIESITSVDGNSVTIKVAYTMHIRSEEDMTDERMYVDSLEELRKLN